MMPSNSLSDDLPQDQEAFPPFETVYDRYHVQVYRYLHAHLKHEQDAADLLQQVFFQAWNQRQTYQPARGTVATWLLAIAHHRLVDFYRQSRPSLSWESIPEGAAADHNPETHARPGGQMTGAREAGHVDANFGQHAFCRAPTDPRNATEQDDGLGPGQRRDVLRLRRICALGSRWLSHLFLLRLCCRLLWLCGVRGSIEALGNPDRLNCLLICGRRELRRAFRSDVRNRRPVYGRTRSTA